MDTDQVARQVTLEFELEQPVTRFMVLGLMDRLTYDNARAALQQRYGNDLGVALVNRIRWLLGV